MILIINLNTQPFSDHEFIRPLTQIINTTVQVKSFQDVSQEDLNTASHIIISGTALKEFEYLDNLSCFNWIKETVKPVLGICAGAQLIARVFGSNLQEHTELGLIPLEFVKQDPLFESVNFKEVYALHSQAFECPKEFDVLAQTTTPQIIKKGNIYGVLFHPEVRNKELITNFINLEIN